MAQTRRLSVTLNPERTSGKVVSVTREEESMDVDSCLPTDENSSRSRKAKEKGPGEITQRLFASESDWTKQLVGMYQALNRFQTKKHTHSPMEFIPLIPCS